MFARETLELVDTHIHSWSTTNRFPAIFAADGYPTILQEKQNSECFPAIEFEWSAIDFAERCW